MVQTCVPSPYISLTIIPYLPVMQREIRVFMEFTKNFQRHLTQRKRICMPFEGIVPIPLSTRPLGKILTVNPPQHPSQVSKVGIPLIGALDLLNFTPLCKENDWVVRAYKCLSLLCVCHPCACVCVRGMCAYVCEMHLPYGPINNTSDLDTFLARDRNPHLPVTPAQLVLAVSCAVGDFI